MPSPKKVVDPFPGKGTLLPGAPGFYKREESVRGVVDLLRAGSSVSVVGERKAGKTSFLYHLSVALPETEFIPAFLDAQLVAPKTDKQFLGELASTAAASISDRIKLLQTMETGTLTAAPDMAWTAFREDLKILRARLPTDSHGQRLKLVWLIDEIETLGSYKDTEIFSFLRPIAASDPDFRVLVAGYDVLGQLSDRSNWPAFVNAFQHVGLKSLCPSMAKQLIADALKRAHVGIDPNLIEVILHWTGKKPFFLKWIMSGVAKAVNEAMAPHHVDANILARAQQLFLDEEDIGAHFALLWSYTTQPQRTVLSLLASSPNIHTQPQILSDLKKERLIKGDVQASQHLLDDLGRLEQLGFLYEENGQYAFTSGCLQDWTRARKPLSRRVE